jgi:tetratricopeptide (TPR) repeat protein
MLVVLGIVFWMGVGLVRGQAGQTDEAPGAETIERAHALAEAHQLEQANEMLADLVRRDPGNEGALVELGWVQIAQGLGEDALKSFEAVLSIKPGSGAAREGEVKAAAAAALADRKSGLADSALVCLLRARKFVPDSPELLLDFGVQAEGMRIFADADEALTKARELAPDDARILYALAHVQFDEGKLADSEANMRAYLKLKPEDATARYGLGRLLHVLVRDDEARVELEKSIALQPEQTGSYFELGEIALEENADSEAKGRYEKVLALAPHHGGALTGMGILAYRAKDYPAAERFLQSAILYAADYARAHHTYALVLLREGRQAESEAESAVATRLNEEQSKTSRGNFMTVIK